MADILQEINERIEKAEKDRDEALKELESLKNLLSSNGIYIKKDHFYVIVNGGGRGWLCWNCPLFACTSEDSGECSVQRDCHRDGKGARAYSLSDIKKGFQAKEKEENKIFKDNENLKTLAWELKKIADAVNKTVAKADRMCKQTTEEKR